MAEVMETAVRWTGVAEVFRIVVVNRSAAAPFGAVISTSASSPLLSSRWCTLQRDHPWGRSAVSTLMGRSSLPTRDWVRR